MDKSFRLLGMKLEFLVLSVGFLYFFGRWSWLTNIFFFFGLLVAGIVLYAVYTHFLRGLEDDGSPRSIPLAQLKTPVKTFGLLSSASADSQFLLSKEQTWTEYKKARSMERLRQRPPQLMSSRPQQIRPKSNVSLSSEDFLHPSVASAFQQQTAIPPQIISRFQGVIGDVIGFVNRDFVLSWYKKLSPEPVVGHRVESMMFHMALEMTRRLERLDMVQIIISKLLPAFTQHVREYRKAERLFYGERLQRPNGQDPEELDFLFARCYKGGNLHPAIPPTQGPSQASEQSYLRNAVKPIVPSLLPKNEQTGRIMTVMAREMIVCKVLQPMMDSLAEPDTWNMMFESLVCFCPCEMDLYSFILYPLSGGENGRTGCVSSAFMPLAQCHDFLTRFHSTYSALAKKINEAVERQDSEDDVGTENPDAIVRPPSFDEYIKLIKNCDNLLDALRIRERINSEIMKKRTEVGMALLHYLDSSI
jgi:hypothetical protein